MSVVLLERTTKTLQWFFLQGRKLNICIFTVVRLMFEVSQHQLIINSLIITYLGQDTSDPRMEVNADERLTNQQQSRAANTDKNCINRMFKKNSGGTVCLNPE